MQRSRLRSTVNHLNDEDGIHGALHNNTYRCYCAGFNDDSNCHRTAFDDYPSCVSYRKVVSLYRSATKPRCRCCFISISNFVISILITGVEESLNDVKIMRLAIAVLVLLAGKALTQRSI